ncbi:D-alanyl-D-alanine carboxypeptidase family protein [Parageobacillus thermoglucosidasius]|uniref:D-alanyl-D-alanine carboxypeptidase family protein n=1 Tax=Parageobacillus thermoglucosidasius TaxID=1426 RepID=UPI000E11FC47|nr:D-alanyl-D-alanine carboxypeptidase family protein [Parageobacillus thermoglucosidasius]MED4906115.1 D-alanyl-D-alanine carboxypeptidase [Parageobacillus thermoglucosidasius]MED4914412.1 D-alanyl-D-alanine carboxypeptidase [Parageobacillus thermoglucosidasius]MED4946839.1 D-alanyl-D-alanine carboxypeptidase [Parageobacillus thermoglucosidasius]MED4982992.1 D-alanyl-D-alanine carboxypeptidase [Parageobacillus thermoglucosidasius]RDE23949.1 D-alanyl-D-alanine carboxypeptidase [Parageobacillus
MKKLLIRLLLFSSVCLLSISINVHAEEKKPKTRGMELADEAKSAILIERDTGAVLYEKNANEKLPPASMTKIMTMLLIMEAIDKGELSYKEKVRASEYAASMGGSQIFLEPGEEMTVDELLRGIAIGSGNDASVALAERIAGSEEAFVEMMNKKAKELGLKNTSFQNATGLPAKGHYSSAHDMAIMARELLKYEDITKYTSKYEDYLRENTDKKFWLVNTNRLVKFYPGVDGLKTGFTSEAKYCLTATAKKNGMRVIAVVFGAPTPKERNAQITRMLDYAFSQYKTHPVLKRNEVVAHANVSKGKKKTVALVTSEPISVLTKKGQSVNKIEKVIKVNKNAKAPIKKGDELGVLILKQDGKELLRSPIVAKENVAEASWWDLFKRTLQNFTKSA